jgi:tetratricopeptide (TPR) repeat protein
VACRFSFGLLWVGVAALAQACAAQPAPPPSTAPVGTIGAHGAPVVVPTTYVSATDAATMAELFEKAKALMLGGKFKEAAAAFDRLVSLEPHGPHTAASLFNAGLSFASADDRTSAMARFTKLVRTFPDAPEIRPALLRAARIQAHDERWAELVATADALLGRSDLTVIERVEAFGHRALGLVERAEIEPAMTAIDRARTLIEDHRIDEGGALPIGASPVFFALGEVRRARGDKLSFSPVPANFSEVLEQRCQLLLDAQDAFATAMRSYDPHWGAMAGYRVGQLYQRLHKDLMAIPAPASAKTDKQKQLFEGAMRLRYRVLIEKGLTMMDRTLKMAERTGERSSWVSRAAEAKTDLERAFAEEKAALGKLPYSEADLQRALDDLAKKHNP